MGGFSTVASDAVKVGAMRHMSLQDADSERAVLLQTIMLNRARHAEKSGQVILANEWRKWAGKLQKHKKNLTVFRAMVVTNDPYLLNAA